ncbi:hypothetical protein ANCCAN_23470, partial [Ancylostoma caninum]
LSKLVTISFLSHTDKVIYPREKVRQGRLLVEGICCRVECEYADLDVKLEFDGFNIKPAVRLEADLEFEFDESLRAANLVTGQIQFLVEWFIRNRVPGIIEDLFDKETNPMLQKLKRVLDGMGLSQFGIEWTVQNGTLRVTVKPQSAMGAIEPIKPIDNMMCISSDLLAALRELKRSKREASELGIELSCTPPEGECTISSCSYCLDFDIQPTTTSGVSANISSCVPTNL